MARVAGAYPHRLQRLADLEGGEDLVPRWRVVCVCSVPLEHICRDL